MSTYVMSDIHGQGKAFYDMLDLIGFGKDDKLYVLGDVIDRGKFGILVLMFIMEHPNIEMVIGNHEYMMLRALAFPNTESEIWFRNGGIPTYEDYYKLQSIDKSRLVDYIMGLDFEKDLICATGRYKLVHGRPFSEHPVSMVYQPKWLAGMTHKEQMIWEEMSVPYTNTDYTVIFGHRCTKHYQDGTPYKIYRGQGMIGVDCGCLYGSRPGRLGCLRLEDLKEFYTEL